LSVEGVWVGFRYGTDGGEAVSIIKNFY
jgi:hypothetical protein